MAGSRNGRGYWLIKIHGKKMPAHRLAWLYVNGDLHGLEVDHINHDKLDNRISNLRLTDRQGNMRNMSKHEGTVSGFTGVCWNSRDKRWMAYYYADKKRYSLGYFTTKEAAINARIAANISVGFHKNHGL